MINWHDLLIIISWLLAFMATGIFGSFILINKESNILTYTLGKSLGAVILALVTWVLSISGILPFSGLVAWIILAFGIALTLKYKKQLIKSFFAKNLKKVLLVESAIILLFVIFITIKIFAPKIEGIEKFMDVAILSNLIRHTKGLPIDTWYSPSTINYYYFGHWIIALWSKMSMVPAVYAFNLGYASVLAVVGGTLLSIGKYVTNKFWPGFLAIFLLLFASNIYPFLYTIKHASYFFFDSGRFVETVINEYPYYSVVLGDLHAHMISLLLGIALLGFITLLINEKSQKQKLTFLVICGGLLGLMAGTNSFDVINYGVVIAIYFVWFWWHDKPSWRDLLYKMSAVTIPFTLLLIINTLSFKPAVGGIEFSLFKTPITHIFWQFGGFIVLLLVGLAIVLLQKNPRQYFTKLVNKQYSLVVILTVSAIILIIITELLYVKDIYHYVNLPYARANTQFKIWYGVWVLLAIASALFVAFIFKYIKPYFYKSLYFFILIFTLLVVSVGTVSGIDYIKDNKSIDKPLTINGANYLSNVRPNKLAIINYVNKNIKGQPIIAQAEGESYTDKSWLSSYTGTASLLGWASHEWGWRYSSTAWDNITQKKADIKKIYESQTKEQLKQNMSQTGVSYILIGPDETELYSINKNIIKEYLGEPIISYGDYQLYGQPNARQ